MESSPNRTDLFSTLERERERGEREMSAIYDKWERLVDAVLKKEQLWQLFHSDSVSPSISSASDSSSFSFTRLTSSLEDVPFSFPSSDQKQDPFGAKSPPRIQIDHPHVENIPPIRNPTSKKQSRKRNLKIDVPKIQVQDVVSSQACCPMVSPGGGGMHSKWFEDAKQKSYPLPLPQGAMPKSTPVSPTTLPLPPGVILSKSTPVSPTIPTSKSPSLSLSPVRAEDARSPWKKGRLIGRGPLGNIYVGFNREKGEMCAMKEVCLVGDAEMQLGVRTLEQEIALLRDMKHPNIVQYLGSEMVGDNFYIYVEYVTGGSIRSILQEYGRLGESAIRNYTQQILAGLSYLHSKDIGHWNIKAASILVDPKGRAKLSSSLIEKHIIKKSDQPFPLDSPYWMAPEVITNSKKRTLASDIWSLGCTVLEMATAKPPLSQYKGVMAMFKVACENEVPVIPDYLSDVCKDFLRCCLQLNPLHRATASQLLDHPFVRTKVPLGKQMVVTKAVKSTVPLQGDYGRSPHPLDSGKAVAHSSMPSKSTFHSSDIYTPRNISAPVSPVGSPLLHPASGQQFKGEMCGPPKSIIGGIGSIQPPHQNQATFQQEASHTLAKQSKISSPSYWDPNILQAVFRFS